MLGFEKTRHQPPAVISSADISEVKKRPSVGMSHSRPTNTRTRWTGALPATRTTRAGKLSSISGASASATATRLHLPPEAADVQREDRHDEQEQEDGDRRAQAEVVDAAEGRTPHCERD